MTHAEALKVAIDELRHIEPNGDGEAFILDEAAARLERLAPFVEAAMDACVFYHPQDIPENEHNLALMVEAYRALSTEETTKP